MALVLVFRTAPSYTSLPTPGFDEYFFISCHLYCNILQWLSAQLPRYKIGISVLMFCFIICPLHISVSKICGGIHASQYLSSLNCESVCSNMAPINNLYYI